MLAPRDIEDDVQRSPNIYITEEDLAEQQDGHSVYVTINEMYALTPAPIHIARYGYNRMREEHPEQYPLYRLLSRGSKIFVRREWTTHIVAWVKLHSDEVSRSYRQPKKH